jgi:hypothetical protein
MFKHSCDPSRDPWRPIRLDLNGIGHAAVGGLLPSFGSADSPELSIQPEKPDRRNGMGMESAASGCVRKSAIDAVA